MQCEYKTRDNGGIFVTECNMLNKSSLFSCNSWSLMYTYGVTCQKDSTYTNSLVNTTFSSVNRPDNGGIFMTECNMLKIPSLFSCNSLKVMNNIHLWSRTSCWRSDVPQIPLGCLSDTTKMLLRWCSDDTQMALRWHSDGAQMALRWCSDAV